MIDVQLDLRSGKPIYTQVVEQIQTLLINGQLQPGDQLPTMRELAAQLGVNFNTVARAYHILDQGGFISTQHGRGTYILDRPQPQDGSLPNDALDRLTRHYLSDAARLGFEPEEIRKRLEEHLEQKDCEQSI